MHAFVIADSTMKGYESGFGPSGTRIRVGGGPSILLLGEEGFIK